MPEKWPDKKDLTYWLILAGFILVATFTFYFGGKDSEMVSYVGFAGTITAIILSALAIILTFLQNASSGNQARKLDETLDQIGSAAGVLKASESEIVAATNALRSSEVQIAASMENIQRVAEEVGRVSETTSRMEAAMSNLQAQLPAATDSQSGPTQTKFADFDKAAQVASNYGLLLLYVCVRQLKKALPMSLSQIVESLNMREKSLRIGSEYAYGFLIGFSSTGLMTLKDAGAPITVESPDAQGLEEAVVRELDLRSKRGDKYARLALGRRAIDSLYDGDVTARPENDEDDVPF